MLLKGRTPQQLEGPSGAPQERQPSPGGTR
jgi:hypothetical protein